MTRRSRADDRLDAAAARLASQRASPAGLALALELVEQERAHRALVPALELLTEAARPEARPALRRRFLDLTEHGSRYDQDCALRVLILRSLQAIDDRDDRDLAEVGLGTVQLRLGVDVAQNLRAEALLLLAQIDPERADLRAGELLFDRHTSTFSGEPAVTAIRVLARRRHFVPIWAIAHQPGLPADLIAQAFASLREAVPADMRLAALRRHLEEARARDEPGEALALVAAEAILLDGLADGYDAVLDLLGATANLNLYRYLVGTIRRAAPALAERLAGERDRRKRAVLQEIFPPR